jgi:hypothetical protein
MKQLLLLLTCCLNFCFFSYAQTHGDSIRFFKQAATLYDLNYSEAQADSLRRHVLFDKSIYQQMHKELPKNDLAFTFAFNPAPYGLLFPSNSKK